MGLIPNGDGKEMAPIFQEFLTTLQQNDGKLLEKDGDKLSAEIWGCLHGLKMVWDAGYKKVLLETDSTNAIELLSMQLDESHHEYSIINEAHQLLSWDWEVKLLYVHRHGNAVADYLAKIGLGGLHGFNVVDCIPNELDSIMRQDAMTVVDSRL
ncbi:uncharacterized protein LOC114725745 [Neltuma alba]|uniref:uncharacterized protein LOC114725745 n=1 Tax=Neltuma alba TaxID=207710 RepID=UPI0010A512C9|nr:uncharacterized protein LOC114725745 [Prosopis alba]